MPGAEVLGHRQEQLMQTLIPGLLVTHLFELFQKLQPSPHFSNPLIFTLDHDGLWQSVQSFMISSNQMAQVDSALSKQSKVGRKISM